jgi:hypothetical protein
MGFLKTPFAAREQIVGGCRIPGVHVYGEVGGKGRHLPFRITTIGGVCILLAIGRRNCSATLTYNPLLDEERAVDGLYTL